LLFFLKFTNFVTTVNGDSSNSKTK
jgi:hypothetical protein